MGTRLFAIFAATSVAFAAAAGATSAQVKWDMPTEQSQSSLTGIADLAFADKVREATDGEIDITVHFGGSLGYKTKDQYDGVGTGALVLADSYTGPLVGFNPIWQVSALPFLTGGIDDAWTLYQAAKPAYEEILASENQMLLYTIPWTPSGIWAKKPVASTDDLKGLKIRTFDPLGQSTFQAAEAEPVILSFTDVVPQLTTGGIEAVLTSAEGGYQNKFPDLLSDFTVINYASPLSVVHINKDTWDGLTDGQRAEISAAAAEVEQMIWKQAASREAENFAKMREAGVTITETPSDEMMSKLRTSAKAAIDDWSEKAGDAGKKILAEYKAATGN